MSGGGIHTSKTTAGRSAVLLLTCGTAVHQQPSSPDDTDLFSDIFCGVLEALRLKRCRGMQNKTKL